VALLGAVRVRDDGSLTAGGYCRPGMSGIATAAHTGYRVLKRTGANQVMILFR
jgi:trimeric autotransporter adhesin